MKTYPTVDQLSGKARAAAGRAYGSSILTAVILLSGVLSALFFWSYSDQVFADVWQPAALVLGLVVGLLPAEGAYFGWKSIRNSKSDMTHAQLHLTTAGVIIAVGCSIFSTFSLFVASFPEVPAEITAYADWFIFLALSLPVTLQMALIALFEVKERDTQENFERAKLGAMGFDSWIKAEQARQQAIIDGMSAALDVELEAYGRDIGQQEAGRILARGSQELLGMGNREGTAVPIEDEPTAAYEDLQALVDALVSERLAQERVTVHTAVSPSTNGHGPDFLSSRPHQPLNH